MSNQLHKEAFAERFKALRKQRGLTQDYFEQQNIASRKSVHNWEKGQIPDVETVIKLCEVLDCDFDYLFGKIDLPHKEETDICRETGLSEAAVEKLVQCSKTADCRHFSSIVPRTINSILVDDLLIDALFSYLCDISGWSDPNRQGSYALVEMDNQYKPKAIIYHPTNEHQRNAVNDINLIRLQKRLIEWHQKQPGEQLFKEISAIFAAIDSHE